MPIPRITFVLTVLLAAASAHAWHDEGHVYAARAAIESLRAQGPQVIPDFFVTDHARDAVAHGSLDPDVVRSRSLRQIRVANAPEHFLDRELLGDRDWPDDRYEFFNLCRELGLSPKTVGLLPYAIAEQAQQLTMGFAEHRRWPDNPHIQAKCLVIASQLAHYTADLHMPLHTTVHYNGRMPRQPDGRFDFRAPREHHGIHAQVDALPTHLPYADIFADPLPPPQAQADLMAFIRTEFDRSHELVERVYELAPRLPAADALEIEDPSVRSLAIERTRAAAHFTASIYLTAWAHSAEVAPPAWLDRDVFDRSFDPARIPPQP